MVRLVALLVCTAPAVLATSPLVASLRGAKQTLRRLGGKHGGKDSMSSSSDEMGSPEKMTEPPADHTQPPADDSTASPVDPTMPPVDGSYEHLGCYNDNKEDRVLGHKLRSPMMNAQMCLEHCNSRGASYMSLQFGNECWCSREADLDYERHGGIGVCDIFCEGDEHETCGGYDAFDLYRLDWPKPSTDLEYMECYADAKHDRVMGHMISQDDMTSGICRAHCEGKHALYYATQFGNECWCGTSDVFTDYERHGKGVCHMGCAGEPTTACGGYNAFSLFRFMGDSIDPSEYPTMSPTYTPTGNKTETPYASPSPASTPSPKTRAPHPCKTKPPRDDSSDHPTDKPTKMPVEPTKPMDSGDDSKASDDYPKETPRPTKAPDSGDGGGGGGGGGGGDYSHLLELHNQIRCMHDAEPLTWSTDVEAHAKKYARELASNKCGQLVHSSGSGYGENLFMCWSGGGNCYTDEGAMKSLYDGEVKGGNVDSFGGHATQILWQSTTELGCALDTCEKGGNTYEVLVCNYNPPGNYRGETANEVMPRGDKSSCGYKPEY